MTTFLCNILLRVQDDPRQTVVSQEKEKYIIKNYNYINELIRLSSFRNEYYCERRRSPSSDLTFPLHMVWIISAMTFSEFDTFVRGMAANSRSIALTQSGLNLSYYW